MKMSESSHTRDSRAILLVDATQEEIMQLHKEMPGWLWFGEDKRSDLDFKPAGQSIDAVIVFARKNKEKEALDVCMRICDKKEMEGIPLFIVGNRYQMDLAHAVRRLPRGDFLFKPINEDKLLNKMKKNVNVSS